MLDFEDHNRANVGQLLKEKGFDFHAEKQPHNATRVAEELRPELMMVSLEMPRLDGVHLIRKFRKNEDFARTPIIAMAGTVNKPLIASLNEMGIKDILTKPLDMEKVLPAVEKYYKLKVIAELMNED